MVTKVLNWINYRLPIINTFERHLSKHPVPKKIKSKFDEYRTTVGDDNSFRKKFRNAVNDYKKGSEKSVRIRLLIILSILVSLFLLFFFI